MAEFEEYYDEVRELSNYDLNKLLDKAGDLPREKFRAILSELEKRGALDEEGKLSLKRLSNAGRDFIRTEGQVDVPPRTPLMDPNITLDPKAPVLFSRYAIRFICILFSPMFAGILMAVNFNRLQKSRPMILVVVFTLLYTYLAVFVAGKYGDNSTFVVLIMNVLCAVILEELFWNRHIGRDFKFRRQYLLPTIIIVLALSFIFALLSLSMAV